MNVAESFKPAIWGEWTFSAFPSGSHVVGIRKSSATAPQMGSPSLYVWADSCEDEKEYAHARWGMCSDLVAFLNGGSKPGWLAGFTRENDDAIVNDAGAKISASGPSYDANPPNLNWRQRDDAESSSNRKILIDFLLA